MTGVPVIAAIIPQHPWRCRLFGHRWERARKVTGERGHICWRCLSKEWTQSKDAR